MAGGILGAITGLFGGGGSPPSINWGPSNTYMNALQSLGYNIGGQSSLAQNNYNSANAGANNAIANYSKYLTTNPGTDQADAEAIAKAEQGASEAGVKAKANLSQDLAQRGVSPGSSIGVGGMANIDESLAANDANIRAARGEQETAQHNANLATNAELLSNAANTQFGRYDTLTGQQVGIDQGLLSAADAQAIQQAEYANQQYQQQQANREWIQGHREPRLANAHNWTSLRTRW